MMRRLIPLVVFIALVALLAFGIDWNKHHEMTEVPSPLIDKTAPEFTLPLLYEPDKKLSRATTCSASRTSSTCSAAGVRRARTNIRS